MCCIEGESVVLAFPIGKSDQAKVFTVTYNERFSRGTETRWTGDYYKKPTEPEWMYNGRSMDVVCKEAGPPPGW